MQPSYLPRPVSAPPRPLRQLVADALRRPGGRRSLSVFTLVLLLAGVGMLAYPLATDVRASERQQQLKTEFDDPTFQQAYVARKVRVGQGLTRLVINNDRMHVDVLVVEGTTPAALRAGAGHYESTPLPGERGNVAIAGHRTTYGRPFNRMDELHAGDEVTLETPFARYTYRVVPPFDGHANPWPVQPNDFAVIGQQGALGSGHWLTLTTCHPKGSAAQRLILRLTLVKTTQLRPSPAPSPPTPSR